jgi:hypothetical protein
MGGRERSSGNLSGGRALPHRYGARSQGALVQDGADPTSGPVRRLTPNRFRLRPLAGRDAVVVPSLIGRRGSGSRWRPPAPIAIGVAPCAAARPRIGITGAIAPTVAPRPGAASSPQVRARNVLAIAACTSARPHGCSAWSLARAWADATTSGDVRLATYVRNVRRRNGVGGCGMVICPASRLGSSRRRPRWACSSRWRNF